MSTSHLSQDRTDTDTYVRRAVITGANSGIGKQASIRFAREGFEVIMVCRDNERGRKALGEAEAEAPYGRFHLMPADLSSFDSICDFTDRFRERWSRLDVLIHNAGYFEHGRGPYRMSPNDVELTFATNVFGPHLMSERLKEPLTKSHSPIILNAGSTSIKNFFDPDRTIEFDNLRGEHRDDRPYSVFRMYADSKMGLLLLTLKAAREYREAGIRVNTLMIPATRVSLRTLKKMSFRYQLAGLFVQNLNPFSLAPDEVAGLYYEICTAHRFQTTSGALFDARLRILQPPADTRPLSGLELLRELWNTSRLPPAAADDDMIERMWDLSNEITEPWIER